VASTSEHTTRHRAHHHRWQKCNFHHHPNEQYQPPHNTASDIGHTPRATHLALALLVLQRAVQQQDARVLDAAAHLRVRHVLLMHKSRETRTTSAADVVYNADWTAITQHQQPPHCQERHDIRSVAERSKRGHPTTAPQYTQKRQVLRSLPASTTVTPMCVERTKKSQKRSKRGPPIITAPPQSTESQYLVEHDAVQHDALRQLASGDLLDAHIALHVHLRVVPTLGHHLQMYA
jgi:hypothetical protein